MTIFHWLLVLCGILLVGYVVVVRWMAQDSSAERLALLVGAHRAWGETDASLKRRSVALSRWPYTKEEPELAWWGRAWARLRALLRD